MGDFFLYNYHSAATKPLGLDRQHYLQGLRSGGDRHYVDSESYHLAAILQITAWPESIERDTA